MTQIWDRYLCIYRYLTCRSKSSVGEYLCGSEFDSVKVLLSSAAPSPRSVELRFCPGSLDLAGDVIVKFIRCGIAFSYAAESRFLERWRNQCIILKTKGRDSTL